MNIHEYLGKEVNLQRYNNPNYEIKPQHDFVTFF
jgi:hypothetical protein